MRVPRWVFTALLFAILWVFVQGPPLAPDSLVATFIGGILVGVSVALVFRQLYDEEIDLAILVSAVPYIVLYTFNFIREVIVANLNVAYRILAPGMPLDPQVILIPLRVESDVGITTIANSITLTPGTVTLGHDQAENALYVHTIDGEDPEGVVEPIRQWEDYALEIFDEEKSASDPAPAIQIHPPNDSPETNTRNTPDSEATETMTDQTGETDQ